MTAAQTPASFAEWVRIRRRQLDLTQAELGQRAGCSAAAIRKIEADERKPSRQLAELLAVALQIPAEQRETFLQAARGALVEQLPSEAGAPPHHLPTLLTSTINRVRDLASVTALLKDRTVHLVTLVGPPGIGKTRLSVECGYALLENFTDGAWFVDLSEITRPEFFLPALARGLPDLDLPPSPEPNQLFSALRPRRLLLILDNFEQIVEGAALEVAQLLQACPQIKILVTSRVPLHLYGEHEYPLPPLSLPPPEVASTPEALLDFEAVQLFAARARQHQPAFRVTVENAQAVVTVCTLLDGIPLALELAAASLRQISLEELAALLRRGGWLRQIASPARDLSARQRTLESVIDWSYTLLAAPQQEFFSTLGVFSGWFDAESAAVVCEIPSENISGMLAALTDHSLLARAFIHGKSCWRMLEVIHEYALAKLPVARRSEAEARRANHFLSQLQALHHSAPRQAQEAFFQTNFGNLQTTVQWAIDRQQTDLCIQLTTLLTEFWEPLGYLREGFDILHRFLRSGAEIEARTRAYLADSASMLAWHQHDFDMALAYAQEAVALFGGDDEDPMVRNVLGRIYIEQEDLPAARAALEECLAAIEHRSAEFNPGPPLAQLGEVALFEGSLEEAQRHLQRAIEYLPEVDAIFRAMAFSDLAELALLKGDFHQARRWLELARAPAGLHIRRALVFLCTLAGYLTLGSSDLSTLALAASLYAAIGALCERSGVKLISFYRSRNEERMRLLRAKLPAQAWQQAEALGRSWSLAEAMEQVV
jgi:predicted ATPase/DNA-binding XRE family transcriptional regulator